MKLVIIISVFLLSLSCGQSFEPTGVYYNDYGQKLTLKKNNKYSAILNNNTVNGTWKSFPSQRVLLNNWRDSDGSFTDRMVTLRGGVLWFSEDNHSKNFSKRK